MNQRTYPKELAPLELWLNDPEVQEIMVNGHQNVYLERHGQLEEVASPFGNDEQVMAAIDAIVTPLGQVDESTPFVDARLSDGARINAVIPPISLVGPVLTIRKFSTHPLTLEDLIRFGAWSPEMVTFLQACVRARLNIVVAGGVGSGKTTVLNAIAGLIPSQERIITVENAAEFRLPASHRHLIRMESRPANIEGKGEVTVRDLVINSLRMRPDRLLVGEVRGPEALELFQAINNGHDGTMMTIHASSPRDVLLRLETMTTMANLSLPLLTIRQMMASAIDLITYQERLRDGKRRILKVTEVVGMQGDVVMLQDIFEFRQTGLQEGQISGYHTATGHVPKCLNHIRNSGIDLPMDLFTPQ
ncbi:MAG: CpaF family protein [Chloroflexota bacterium]